MKIVTDTSVITEHFRISVDKPRPRGARKWDWNRVRRVSGAGGQDNPSTMGNTHGILGNNLHICVRVSAVVGPAVMLKLPDAKAT